MALILERRGQHDFPIAGNSQAPSPVPQIVNGEPANFNVITGGNDGFHPYADIMITTMEFRHMAMKCDIILVRDLAGWLASGGPELSVFFIMQIYP